MTETHKVSTAASTIFRWTVCGQLAQKKTSDMTWWTVTCADCLNRKDKT